MYKRIMVALDGSESSNKALTAALQLARQSGARVRLVHVMEEMAYLSGFDQYGGYSGDLVRVMRENATRILDDGMARARDAGVESDNMLHDKFGERLGEALADAAKRWEADLIVVGTHGRRGVSRLLIGSGAEQIVRLAPVPVLVIR